MSYTNITPGFTGYALVNGQYLRFATCSLNAVQEVEAPDMVMGDYTHNAWAYGKIEVGGQLSGPLTENAMDFVDEIWGSSQTIYTKYYAGYQREFLECTANSLTLNVNAGEIVNFTLDVLGKGFQNAADVGNYTTVEKLLTWDKSALYYGTQSTTPSGSYNLLEDLQSFNITITNNITRQFAIKASDLYGQLVRGMSAVTGQFVHFDLKSNENVTGSQFGAGAEHWDDYDRDAYYPIRLDVGNKTISATVVFHRGTSELSVGPVLTTVGFTGIGHWGGENPLAPVHAVIA